MRSSAGAEPLVLGGVTIPMTRTAMLGHSDADALCHAITDALLGARGAWVTSAA